jgi:hypothetical protein
MGKAFVRFQFSTDDKSYCGIDNLLLTVCDRLKALFCFFGLDRDKFPILEIESGWGACGQADEFLYLRRRKTFGRIEHIGRDALFDGFFNGDRHVET